MSTISKRINDQFGHDKGDEVLVLLAKKLESRVRETDSVCRWGGEEFTILLTQTDIGNAAHLAECLRVSVTEIQISALPRITVSIGVAPASCMKKTTESLLRRADTAPLSGKGLGAKQRGRRLRQYRS